MSQSESKLPASNAEPPSPEPAHDDRAYGLVAMGDGEPCGASRTDKDADFGGHTLLVRSIAPQGRRSLFRR